MDSPRAALARQTAEYFRGQFKTEPHVVVTAPGRVNLIGEHTDYNDGFVLPAAIDRATAIAASPRSDRNLVIHAQNLKSTMMLSLADLTPRRTGAWSNYVAGVAHFLRRRGDNLVGANMLINSTVPRGSGLSSSAALEVAAACTFISLNGLTIPDLDVIVLCQQAENEFVGVQCGIMDQFISYLGKKNHALRIDCRSLEFLQVPIPAGVRLLICDTGVRRSLASSEYNRRREECDAGVSVLSRHLPGILKLRDVSPGDLARCESFLDQTVYRRCRHVVTENARVEDSVRTLRAGDLSAFGQLMYESHRSLRVDYEVSCRELDMVVDICMESDGVLGARMTGAGFGGSVVCCVREEAVEVLAARLARDYPAISGRQPGIHVCSLEDGVAVEPR